MIIFKVSFCVWSVWKIKSLSNLFACIAIIIFMQISWILPTNSGHYIKWLLKHCFCFLYLWAELWPFNPLQHINTFIQLYSINESSIQQPISLCSQNTVYCVQDILCSLFYAWHLIVVNIHMYLIVLCK